MAYSVTERTREIGIRIALGAGTQHVFGMIFRQATCVIGIGLLLGVAGAVAISRLLRNILFGITATDPLTYAAVSIRLLLTAAIAWFVPTQRAISVDPTVSLRQQ